MKRRERRPEAVTVPAHLSEPHVEDYVEPGEVSSVGEAQALAGVRHSDEWSAWYADLPTATVEVPVVSDRAMLGTEQVDDVVEMTGPLLEGLSVQQTRRQLLSEPLPFRDRAGFERGLP